MRAGALLAACLLVGACVADEPAPADEGPPHPADHPGYDWQVHEADAYRLYYPAALRPAPDIRGFERLITAARADALELMGEPDDAPPIPFFLVPSRADVKTLTGYEANGITMPAIGAVVMVYSGAPNILAIRHETMHVLTTAVWGGYGPGPWVREGLGVLAGGPCSGYTHRAAAAYARSAGTLPTLAELESSFWDLDEITGHLAAASFMAFVHEAMGPEGLRTLWQGGLRALGGQMGADIEALETDWRAWLAEPSGDAPLPDWSVVSSGCRWTPPGAVR